MILHTKMNNTEWTHTVIPSQVNVQIMIGNWFINLYLPVFTWILSRNMEPLEGDKLKKVEDALSKYPELVENRKSFVLKNFSEASCAYSNKLQSGSFTGNFWWSMIF